MASALQERILENRKKAAQLRISEGRASSADYKLVGQTPPSNTTLQPDQQGLLNLGNTGQNDYKPPTATKSTTNGTGAQLSNQTVKTNTGQITFGQYVPPTGLSQDEIESSKTPINSTKSIRNSAFDALTAEEKAENAKRADPSHPDHAKFIPHLLTVDNPLASGNSINYNVTRDEKVDQYKQSFASSPDTPQNFFRNTQNRSKENQIMSTAEATQYLKTKFGLSDKEIKDRNLLGRVYYKYEEIDPNTGEKIDKVTGENVERLYGDETPVVLNSATDDESRFRTQAPSSGEEFSDGSNYIRRSDGSLEKQVGALTAEYEQTSQGRQAKLAATKQEFESGVQAKKDEYAEQYYQSVLKEDPEFKEKYATVSKTVQAQEQAYNKSKFINDYMRAVENWKSANDGRSGQSLDYYINKKLGMTKEAAQATFNGYITDPKTGEKQTISSYHIAKSGRTWENNAYQAWQKTLKEQQELEQSAKEKAIKTYEENNADKLSAEQSVFDSEYAALETELKKEDELGKINLDAGKESALSKYLEQQGLSNNAGAENENEGNISVGGRANAVGGYTQTKTSGGYDIAGDLRDKLTKKHEEQVADSKEALAENKANLIKQYENQAARAQTKEAGQRYLAQKMALINGSESTVLAKLEARQAEEREDLDSRIRLDPALQGITYSQNQIATKQASGSALNIKDLLELEKIEFIKSYAETDEGDANTVITRALAAYEKASKLSSEEGLVSELEVGQELDDMLKAWGDLEALGDDVTPPPSLRDKALNPAKAYEWLLNEGVKSDVAKEMLQLRGLDGDMLRSAQTEYWKSTFGMTDEEITALERSQGSKTMRTRYLNGELSDEEATAYLERVAADGDAGRAKKTGSTAGSASSTKKSSSGKYPASGTSAGTTDSNVANAERANRSQYTDARDEVVGLLRMGVLEPDGIADYIKSKYESGRYGISTAELDAITKVATEYSRSTGERVSKVGTEYDNDPEVLADFQRMADIQAEIEKLGDSAEIMEDNEQGKVVFVDGVQRQDLSIAPANAETRKIYAEFSRITSDSEKGRYIARLNDKNPKLAALLAKLSNKNAKPTRSTSKVTEKSTPTNVDADDIDSFLDSF